MDALSTITQERLVVLARRVPVEDMAGLTKALYDGGIRVFEVPFDPADSDTLEKTAKSVRIAADSGMLAGAGTVLSEEMAEAARAAGARFIISPNTDERVIRKTKELGMLSIPGAYTPTEIVRAHELGADIVKIFPVLPWQADYVGVLAAPLPHIKFMVTGGVNPGNIAEFLNAGAMAVAAGAAIIRPELVRSKDWSSISGLARAHLDAIKEGVKNVR